MRPLFRPQRLLLTGASGTIGSRIGPALLDAGISLRVLVHRHRPAWIEGRDGVEVRVGDVLAPSTLHGVGDGCDAVVHAAGAPGFGVLDRGRRRRVHVDGTQAMLHEAASAGCRVFVHVGYTGVVQEGGDEACVEEESPPGGNYESDFVRTLMEAETLTLESNRPGVFRTMVASHGVLVGAGLHSPLSGLARSLLHQELPYRFLDDVWLAITGPRDIGAGILAALSSGQGGRRYFLTGAVLRLGEFHARLALRAGVPAPRRRLPDLLVEELGLLTPVLPPNAFLRQVVLPREMVLHLRRLAPLRNERTRAELGFAPEPLEEILEGLVKEAGSATARRRGSTG